MRYFKVNFYANAYLDCHNIYCDNMIIKSNYDRSAVFLRLFGYHSDLKKIVAAFNKKITLECYYDSNRSTRTYIQNSVKVRMKYKYILNKDQSSSFSTLTFYVESNKTSTDSHINDYIYLKKADIEDKEQIDGVRAEVLAQNEKICDAVYDLLCKTKIPLMREWIPYIILQTDCITRPYHFYPMDEDNYDGSGNDFQNSVRVLEINISESQLKDVIKQGLQSKEITMGENITTSSTALRVTTLDGYLSSFMSHLTTKIQDKFIPQFNPSKQDYDIRCKDFFNYASYYGNLELYTAQKNVINAVALNLKKNNSSFIVGECGSGKTAMSIGSVYAASKKENPLCAIMAPSHLVNKWKRDIMLLYPMAKAVIISDFSDLYKIEPEMKSKNRNYPLFLIISKEVAKLSYVERPSVIYDKVTNMFICPSCGKIIDLDFGKKLKITKKNNTYFAFLKKNNENSFCKHSLKKNPNNTKFKTNGCEHSLWTMYNTNEKNNSWIKLTNYGWINIDTIDDIIKHLENIIKSGNFKNKDVQLLDQLKEIKNGNIPTQISPRRYSIAKYLRKHYKNFIDFFIADEMHLYSSSSSAQAEAFGDLVQCSKKMIGLTGTLLNGYASGIFNLLYRVISRSLNDNGFRYNSTTKFVEEYGVLRTTTVTSENSSGKTSSKSLPGVSPLLFTKYLLENSVFISLSDMSEALANYIEIPVGIEMDDLTKEGYKCIVKDIQDFDKNVISNKNCLNLQGMQILSCYPDQPFDLPPIYSAKDNMIVAKPKDIIDNELRPLFRSMKDIKLLEIAKEKIASGEKVLVYSHWTGNTDCQDRLKKLFENEGIKACILDNSVKSINREEWIKTKVAEGNDVMICNPMLVETGLDLLDFTTIVFYQLGYSLFTMRQASRRSLRLNQTKDVSVYYLYFKDTIQEQALSLMATKLQAAMTIEGKFSEEGLNALSENEDILSQIANSVIEDISIRVDDGSFNVFSTVEKDDDGSRFILKQSVGEKYFVNKYNAFNKCLKKRKNYQTISVKKFLKIAV